MKFLLLALILGIALPSFAQPPVRRAQVYRCGPDGRDLRDSPCPGGTAASSTGADPSSAADGGSRMAEAKLAAARRASEIENRRQHSKVYGLQEQPASAPAPASATAKPAKAASAAAR